MNVLVTGGAGFIGSHTSVELLQAGHNIVIFDNYLNSCAKVIGSISSITGKTPIAIEGDVRDRTAVADVIRKHKCQAVIHFAGLKAVNESIQKPLEYYDYNVVGALRVLEAMAETNVHTFLFSSSATVYGVPQKLPVTEDHPLSAINPYGWTKLVIEGMLNDLRISSPDWRIGILRYFNPVGAHESGLIGENPKGVPQNLFPYVTQVAVGQRPYLNIWGNDYETPDGTCLRDYIHIVDLAQGHLKALEKLERDKESFIVNLGTGRSHSVLEVVHAFERTSGRPVPFKIMPRRAGDVASCYADPTYAKKLLGWTAKKDLTAMCMDGWRWQSHNAKNSCSGKTTG